MVPFSLDRNVYQLPLPTYSFGNLVVTMLGTVTSLVSAYIIDHIAAKSVMSNYRSASSKRARGQARVDLIGLSGCLSALYFLAPFFRWWDSGTLSDDDAQYAHNTGRYWGDGVHFVVSITLYNAMHSFTSILIAAVVNDNLHMSDQARVSYMASGKVASFIASFVFARIGLALFDTVTPEGANNLFQFRLFLISASVIVAGLFIKAQLTISDAASPANQYSHGRRSDNDIDIGSNHNNGGSNKRDKVSRGAGGLWRRLFLPKRDLSFHGSDDDNDDELFVSDGQTPEISVQLKWKQIIVDFWEHKNFRAWIGMEMLLEAQTTFVLYFLKTFVDGLLLENEGGVIGRQSCDWLLSAIRPLTQVVSIFIYIPIRRMGYRYVYSGLFYCNIFLSVLLLSVVDVDTPAGAYWIVFYMCTYPVLTGGVQSAGFHLAQADLVMEMKRKHILDGRYDEPSLAGLFMGANALLCKPVESFLPITAATVLQEHKESKVSLFYLLVLPPLICSCLQILSWSQFDLTPRRTARMRNEVKKLRSSALDILPMDL